MTLYQQAALEGFQARGESKDRIVTLASGFSFSAKVWAASPLDEDFELGKDPRGLIYISVFNPSEEAAAQTIGTLDDGTKIKFVSLDRNPSNGYIKYTARQVLSKDLP